MQLQYTDVAKQISALAERLQRCEDIQKRNEMECELRALEMVIAYRANLGNSDEPSAIKRAAA